MSESESVVVWAGRLLFMFVIVIPFAGPLGDLIGQLGFMLGVGHRQLAFAPAVVAAPIAGLLVAYEERRYGSVLIAGVLTQIGWVGLTRLSGLSAMRVHGDPWLFAGELFMYVSAASLAIVAVFFVEWKQTILTGI